VLPESRAREIVKTFLQTPFEGGRHAARVSKIESR
jgi:ribose 5-phosphate isomerase RpiB